MIPLPRPRFLRALVFALAAPLLALALSAAPAIPRVTSPNGHITVDIRVGKTIAYDVAVNDRAVLHDATLSLTIDGRTFGRDAILTAVTPAAHDATLEPVVRQKAARFRDHYNELRLDLAGNAAVVFRAYDEGVAYRWETSLPQPEVKVDAEEAAFNFTGDYTVYYPEEDGFYSHNERLFEPRELAQLATKNLASIPVVVDADGVKVAISDAAVEEYPGLWFRGTGGHGLTAAFPPYPLKEELTGDRDFKVTQAAAYIAVTKGTRVYPWRALGLAMHDGDLVENPLLYLLAAPSRLADTSWIKPGKVAWDWWNANNLTHVNFKAGINTATYQAYIDFAAANGLSYIILDEGWYKLGDLLSPVPEVDVPALVAYGKKKNVGVILWCVWKTLDDQLEPALDRFASWGVRGVKVDFMQRDDQKLMEFYYRTCAAAAQRHLLVDFHGGIRAAMLTRTWPNLISTEGVRGMEWNKWSTFITPEHIVSLPFTRQFIGPMDFTPGAMGNAMGKNFTPRFTRPMSQDTRCQQLALYVVFESPLQMLCDSPSNYEREPDAMDFLRSVPTEWDESHVLDARISDYVLIARRHGSDWFVGAITDATPRDLAVNLSFLPAGRFRLDAWRDGLNADRNAEDYARSTEHVTRNTKLPVHLAPGGGWVARITPE
ncbi:MAG TPA: glycoside hydrolase family 97 protein [Opitutus sp.]|nr:glycoside hydrolase family 97 protein [Opitutus sp.]